MTTCIEGETCTGVEFGYKGTFSYPVGKTITSGSLSGKMVYCGPEDPTDLQAYSEEKCNTEFKTAFTESMSKKDVTFTNVDSGFCISPVACNDCVEESHIEEFKKRGDESSETENREEKYSSADSWFVSGFLLVAALVVPGLV